LDIIKEMLLRKMIYLFDFCLMGKN